MSNCVVCDEQFNKAKIVNVRCEYCTFEACRPCCEKYILDQKIAKCMNSDCKKEWTRKFLSEHFTKTFLNTSWKKSRESVLFDMEKAMLPATQAIIEERKIKLPIQNEIKEIEQTISDLLARKDILKRKLNDLSSSSPSSTSRSKLIRACPEQNCRGFLNPEWKCGLCDQTTCSDCGVIIKGGGAVDGAVDGGAIHPHVCNPDDIETAKLLASDTKPCPNCAIGIFKIEGCDQMWCTQCHVAFSWRTGRMERNIHNPHYYEWIRRNNGEVPRAVGDNFVCGEELQFSTVNKINSYLALHKETDDIADQVSFIVQSVLHFRYEHLPKYRGDATLPDNQNLRILYLENSISEDEFKVRIQRTNKRILSKREVGGILELFYRTVTEIMLRMAHFVKHYHPGGGYPKGFLQDLTQLCGVDKKDHKAGLVQDLTKFLDEVEAIRKYCNDCLQDVASSYGIKTKYLYLYNHHRGRLCECDRCIVQHADNVKYGRPVGQSMHFLRDVLV